MNFQIDDNQPFFLQAIDYHFARAEEDLNSVTSNEWVKAPLGFSMGVAHSLIHLPVSLFQFAKHFVSEFPQRVEQSLRQNPYNPLILVGAPLVEAGKLLFYEPMVGLVEQLREIRNGVEQTGEMNWQQAGAFAFGASLLAKGATDTGMGMLNTIENIGTGLANSVRNSGPPPLATTGTLVIGEAAAVNTLLDKIPPPIIQRTGDEEAAEAEIDPVFLLRALDKALAEGKIGTALDLMDQMTKIGGRSVLKKLHEVAEAYLNLDSAEIARLGLYRMGRFDPTIAFLASQIGFKALMGLTKHKSPYAFELAKQLARGEKNMVHFVWDRVEWTTEGFAPHELHHFRGTILEPTHPFVLQTVVDVLKEGDFAYSLELADFINWLRQMDPSRPRSWGAGIALLDELLAKTNYRLEEASVADAKIVGDSRLFLDRDFPKRSSAANGVFSIVSENHAGSLFLKLVEANPELAKTAFAMEEGRVFLWPPRFGAEDVVTLQSWMQHPPPWLKPYWSEIRVLALRQTDFPHLRFQAAIDILKEPEAVRRFISGGGEVSDALGDVLRHHAMGIEPIVEEIIAAQPGRAFFYSWISNESVWAGIYNGLRRRIESKEAIEFLVEHGRIGHTKPVEILIEAYGRYSRKPSLRERFARALEETGSEAAADFFDSERVRLPAVHFVQRRRLAERAARVRAVAGHPSR